MPVLPVFLVSSLSCGMFVGLENMRTFIFLFSVLGCARTGDVRTGNPIRLERSARQVFLLRPTTYFQLVLFLDTRGLVFYGLEVLRGTIIRYDDC